MNIRNRLLLSYIILVVLVLLYAILLVTFGNIQDRVEEDIIELHNSKDVWNNLLISMNELQINWADGNTFNNFKNKCENLEQILEKMATEPSQSVLSRNDLLQKRKIDLYATWSIASESIASMISKIESPDFVRVTEPLTKKPGLQRLNWLWFDLYGSYRLSDKKDAYTIRQVLEEIEFFPIYSDTLNNLLNVTIDETEELFAEIKRTQLFSTFLFFLTFLAIYMVFAIRFAGSLSKPIIKLSVDLSSFIGQTLKLENISHTNEVKLLKDSADSLMDHYTYLAELAERLAVGEIKSPLLDLPEQGVVGKALQDINIYLNELAETSQWIKDGRYGARIRVKSESDVLAENFNIMSSVINEKIKTLTNILESVDESIVVTNHRGVIIETNSNFLHLSGLSETDPRLAEEHLLSDFFDNTGVKENLFRNERTFFTEIKGPSEIIPVKVIHKPIRNRENYPAEHMFSISNESLRVRMEREKETLRVQAVEAELKALRAQINPHFLFNTLNGIAHLIESGGEDAVTMIEELSELFRYSLASTRRNTVKLYEEIETVKHYLSIEGMRFGNRLEVVYSIEKAAENFLIPPMLLQPLIENAVKYGAEDSGRIFIQIEIKRNSGSLNISISDSGTGVKNPELLLNQQGTGIRNVNQRLNTLFNQSLEFMPNNPRGLKVAFTIPEIKND